MPSTFFKMMSFGVRGIYILQNFRVLFAKQMKFAKFDLANFIQIRKAKSC